MNVDEGQRILQEVRRDFMTYVDARAIARKARMEKVIPEAVEITINQSTSLDAAKQVLFEHLHHQVMLEGLRRFCSIMIDSEGYQRMQMFGKGLLVKLKEEDKRRPLSVGTTEASASLPVSAPENVYEDELTRKCPRSSTQSSEDREPQHSVAKKSLPDYTGTKMDLLVQDISDLRSGSDPKVVIKLLYGNALNTISDLLEPHLKAVKKAAGRYQRLGVHHVAVGEDIIESADSIDSLMSRMSVGGLWDQTDFLRKVIASIPHSAPERDVAEAIHLHYHNHLAIFKRFTFLKDALSKESESEEEVEAPTEANKPVKLQITSSKAFDNFSCEDCLILQARGLAKGYGIPEREIICRDVEECQSTTITFQIPGQYVNDVIQHSCRLDTVWILLELDIIEVSLPGVFTFIPSVGRFLSLLRGNKTFTADLLGVTEVLPYQTYCLLDSDTKEPLSGRPLSTKRIEQHWDSHGGLVPDPHCSVLESGDTEILPTHSERAKGFQRAEELQKQRDEMYRDADLQRKMDLIRELRENEQQMKTKLVDTAKKLDIASSERAALWQEKGHLEEHLEALSQNLKSAQDELNVSANAKLELIQQHRTLQCDYDRLESSTRDLERELSVVVARKEALEEHFDEETKKCQCLEDKCNSQAFSIQKLEAKLDEEGAQKGELERQLDEKAEMCRQIESERAREFQRAEKLQKQRDEMYRDHESLRKYLQRKMDLIREFKENEQQMKAKLEAKKRDLEHSEKQLEDARQCLKEKVEECKAFESTQLQLLCNMEDLKREKQQLAVQVMQKEAELATLVAERSALCGQLKDFAVIKAENESLKNDAEERAEMMRQCEEKSRRLARLEERLNKEKMALTTERRLVMKQRKQMDTEFVRSRNLEAKLEAKKRDLENSEKQLEDARQCLKEKVEECKAFESTQLQLLPNMEDLKQEKQQLAVQVMQKEAELATLEAERSALCGQLKDFAVIKAENESLKNDAEERTELMRQCEDKSRRIARLEERLNKERMDLTTERRLVMEQKKKMNTDFARSRNLESIVKRSVQESFELLNASGREMSESGQNSDTVVEGKQEVEEAWRQEKREIQRQLDRARREIKQLKDAERKAQDSSEEMHKLAQTYFQSHRYPPFLYQLHQLQKHLHSSGVQGISTLGDGRTVEVTRVTDLRSFTPYESWSDEFQSLIVKLKTMPSKQCQAYMLISFLHCGEVITFYRFHVALVPQVLSCERDLHPNELEGDAMPKAMLVYAHTELKSNNLKEFGITPHRKGVLLQPQCEGYVPELTRSQLLRKLKDTPAGLKHTEECLDANILHQLQRQYREFAKPRTAHRGPPMGVAMALI